MITSLTGQIHFLASCIALITGTYVLLATKGSTLHKKVGYVYVASMIVLLVTAFMIFRLFGGFGIFHVAAIVSSVTLAAGMIPVIGRKNNNWVMIHFAWMYWSVMGLYAAFASEMITRLLPAQFFSMVGLATGAIMTTAAIVWYRKKKVWQNQFNSKQKNLSI
ncbi:MAG: DUF2306 domain-containing protein [Bacteroidota bacterium]